MPRDINWVSKDAFVLPILPEELRIDPTLAALIHATAFLELSGDKAVDPDWAVEALEHVAFYLQRLSPSEVEAINQQLARIVNFATENAWPDSAVEFVRTFLAACGMGEEE